MDRPRILFAYGLLALNMAVWAGHAVVARAAAGDIPPLSLNFWRWLLAFLILAPFALPRLRRNWALARAHWRWLAIGSLFSVILFTALFYLGLNYTTSLNATLISMALPVFIVLTTWAARLEYVTLRQGIGLALSLAGVAVIVSRGDPAVLLGLRPNPGDLIIVGAMLCWGLYSVVLRRIPEGFDYLTLMAAMMLIGLPVLAALYAWEYVRLGPFDLSPGNLTILAYVATGPALVSFFCWMWAVRIVGANKAGFTNCLVPIFTAVLAWLFLDERLEPYHALGFAVILAGMYLAILAPAPPSRGPSGGGPSGLDTPPGG